MDRPSPVLGFIEDLFAVGVLAGIITFAVIRLRHNPSREGCDSRFSGSHTSAAWYVLLGIFLVISTLLVARGGRSTPATSRMRTARSPRRSLRTDRAAGLWDRLRSSGGQHRGYAFGWLPGLSPGSVPRQPQRELR